jgi:hypothetical protein
MRAFQDAGILQTLEVSADGVLGHTYRCAEVRKVHDTLCPELVDNLKLSFCSQHYAEIIHDKSINSNPYSLKFYQKPKQSWNCLPVTPIEAGYLGQAASADSMLPAPQAL